MSAETVKKAGSDLTTDISGRIYRCLSLSALIFLLIAMSAHAITVRVEKRGPGTGSLTSEIGECGSATPTCTYELQSGDSIGLLYQRDNTGAQLLGWGGACLPYEDNLVCTVTVNDALQRLYPGTIPIIAGIGYAQDGTCRAPGGIWDYMYFSDLATAYNAVKGAVVTNPVECKTGVQPPLVVDSELILNGGFASFTPPTIGDPTTINKLTVTTGTLTIAQGSLEIACGWTEVTGPYVISTGTLTIGATPCDYGFIVR